ncbi:unnamed protein product [Rotaria sp. Silwood2]|nr:unnamed protein product [Rotaria sp. Silwood2]CAF4335410.1 unnamed protein product [Rotaria sp. Silwood2]
MASRSTHIGFEGVQDQLTRIPIGFEGLVQEYDNNVPTNSSSVNKNPNSSLPIQRNKVSSSEYALNIPKTMPSFSSSSSSKSNENSQVTVPRLFTSFLSAVYTEFYTVWFRKKWLIFSDNHKEIFLTLRSDISCYLTVQMAIDQNCFVNNKLPLLNQPECLLIRTEANNKSLFLPNSIISFEKFFDKNIKKFSHGKLIAILCESDKINNKLMFYKHSLTNHWYIFYNDLIKPSRSFSNILSNEEQHKLESILTENNHRKFIHPSELVLPLSSLCYHPITYIYISYRKIRNNLRSYQIHHQNIHNYTYVINNL